MDIETIPTDTLEAVVKGRSNGVVQIQPITIKKNTGYSNHVFIHLDGEHEMDTLEALYELAIRKAVDTFKVSRVAVLADDNRNDETVHDSITTSLGKGGRCWCEGNFSILGLMVLINIIRSKYDIPENRELFYLLECWKELEQE